MVRSRTRQSIAASIAADSGRIKRRAKNAITKSEVKRRAGYIFLGIFAAYLIDPIHNFIEGSGIPPFLVAVVGILFTFYYFDF